MTTPSMATLEKIKNWFKTLGFVFIAMVVCMWGLKGCFSGCSLGGSAMIERTYKHGFPIHLTKGQPSAVYKAPKKDTKYLFHYCLQNLHLSIA